MLPTRHTWTPAQLHTLQRLYPGTRTAAIAQQLGIRLALVYAKANRIGLHKDASFFGTSKSGRILRGGTLSQATQFQPGAAPWNKGTTYMPGGRCKDSQFKPGQKPTGTMPIGSLRVVTDKTGRQHLERKTSDTPGANNLRWTPVARLVWTAAHGPVPKGSLVVFKKGMHSIALEDITIDKLECITRAQNADRNHPNRSNPELAKLVQLKGQITRQVNRIAREQQQPTHEGTTA
jgi:hypothetical protein